MTGFDFNFSNDKPALRDLLPIDVPLLVEMTYTPGGADIPGTPQERKTGALTQSKTTDALYLKTEFTVLRGPYKGRKFWSNLTVWGGKLDEKGASKGGNISRESIRSILDSSQGLSGKDESPEAAAKRVLPEGWKSLQRRRFVCLAKVEKGKDGYADKSALGAILTVDMAKYPRSDADFDAPAKAAASAIAAPAWDTAVQPATQTQNVAATPAPVAAPAPVLALVPDPVPATPTPAPAASNSGLPAWAA